MRPAHLAQLDRLSPHLPFKVDDFDAARAAFASWKEDDDEASRKTTLLWIDCFILWYFRGKLSRERISTPSDVDALIDGASRRIFRALDRIREPGKFPEYVSVTCLNVLRSYRERRKTTVELNEDLALVSAPMSTTVDQDQFVRLLDKLVPRLSPAIGGVVQMRLREGRSYRDVARATGLPLATVRTYHSKGLAKLREHPCLRDFGPDPEAHGSPDRA